MNPELHDFATSLTFTVRKLAVMVERLARLQGFEETAVECERIGQDVLDAYNQLEGQ